MQLGSEGAKIPLPTASPRQSHAVAPRKFNLCSSKGHRLAYVFIFNVKFCFVFGIFV